MSFEDWLKEVDAELEELRERNKKIIEEKKKEVKNRIEQAEKEAQEENKNDS